jgi:hypothetical protein
MSRLRSRWKSVVVLVLMGALCLGLQWGRAVTARDKTAADPASSAGTAPDDAQAPAADAANDAKTITSLPAKAGSTKAKGRPESSRKSNKKSSGKNSAKPAKAEGDDEEAPDPELVSKVMAIQDRNTAQLMSQKGVVGTATGLDDDGNVVVRVYTSGADEPQIPAMLDGIPVQTVLTGPIHAWPARPKKAAPQAAQSPTSKFARPVPIGVSSMADTSFCAAATLGCRVKDSNGNVYALSCNHVYALENQGQIGVTPASQPSPLDVNCQVISADDFGTLTKFVTIDFSGGNNTVDCAIVKTSTNLVGNATPSDGYGTPRSSTVAASLFQSVQKYGRTSGQSTGTVNAVNVTVLVGYDSGNATFVKQIEVVGSRRRSSLGQPGDSGSLVVDSQRRPVGLLFAGGGGLTFCNPIGPVLQQLAGQLGSGITLTVDGN